MELTVSYLHGRILAAYLTLRPMPDMCVARSHKTPEGLVIDYDKDDRELGIEIPTPTPQAVRALEKLLGELHVDNAEKELGPLQAAVGPT